MGLGLAHVMGTFASLPLIDRVDRTYLLAFTYFCQGIASLAMAMLLHIQTLFSDEEVAAAATNPAIISIFMLSILMFAMGVGPVTGILVPELLPGVGCWLDEYGTDNDNDVTVLVCLLLLPAKIRGSAVDTAFGLGWIFHLTVCQFYVVAVESLGLATISALFGLVSLIGAWFARFHVPETRGKSLAVVAAAG